METLLFYWLHIPQPHDYEFYQFCVVTVLHMLQGGGGVSDLLE